MGETEERAKERYEGRRDQRQMATLQFSYCQTS